MKEDVEIESERGLTLRGYLFKRREPSSPGRRKTIIVYFQGPSPHLAITQSPHTAPTPKKATSAPRSNVSPSSENSSHTHSSSLTLL